MRSHFKTGLFLAGLALLAGAGCATRPPVINSEQAAAFRARAEARFARGFYLKPAEAGNVFAQAWQLAPLFIIEVSETNSLPDLPVPVARPQIFFQPGHTVLNGRQHEQMTYWWTYPKDSRARRNVLPAQGIRITLDSAGQPVIWETLADASGARVIFVAQSLELKAVQQFGTPLEGRRFAIERPLTDAPEAVVARVIEDGPVTMGPIIYLHAGTRDVTTVICRCMEAQARELSGQQEYDLVYAPKTKGLLRKPGEIQLRLRLPGNF